MNSLHAKFFQYLEDIREQEIPIEVKLSSPDQFPLTPEDLDVKGDLSLAFNKKITSLPDNLKVKGYLDLTSTTITSLPNNLQVEGSLYLSRTEISSLPKDLQVGNFFVLDKTPLSFKTYDEIYQMAPGIKGSIFGLNKD